jgi:hypothetical protein
MKFTEKENKYLKKTIKRLEKDNNYWPWLRWMILLASVVSMGSALYTFYMLQKLIETMTSSFSIPLTEYNFKLLNGLIEGKMATLRMEYIFMQKIAMQEILGIALFAYCIANWNRHIKQAIMIKLIRNFTTKEENEN